MENITAKPTRRDLQSEQRIRARLVDLGRSGGMSDGQIGLALRAGNVARISGRKSPRSPTLFVAADLDRITAAFLAAFEQCCDWIITLEDIRSDSLLRRYTAPRMCLALLLRELTGASFPAIAMHLGRMDHTTIMHACRTGAPRAMRRDPDLAQAVARVKALQKAAA